MNVLVMMGRLTRDPEVRYGANGNAVARFSLAVDRRFKREGQADADFFNCVSFGRQAEFVEKYLRKGIKVVIQGSLQNDNYTNREGQMVYRDQIVIDNIEFAESKSANDNARGAASGNGSGGYRSNNGGNNRSAGNRSAGNRSAGNNRGSSMDDAGFDNYPDQADMDNSPDGFMNIPDGIDEELPFS